MRTIVRFRTAEGDYAVSAEQVTEVRSATGLAPLPSPLPGVAGLMLHGKTALPVLTVLGELGRHVVVMEKGPLSFGLLVDEVTGVVQVDEAQIGAPPLGQDGPFVSGIFSDEGGADEGDTDERSSGERGRLVLLLDVDALAEKLAR
jgi:chemotaxis signal transduction protein